MAKSVKKKQTAAVVAAKKGAKAQISLEERIEVLERNMLILTLCVAGLIGFVLVYAMMDDEPLWARNNSAAVDEQSLLVEQGE